MKIKVAFVSECGKDCFEQPMSSFFPHPKPEWVSSPIVKTCISFILPTFAVSLRSLSLWNFEILPRQLPPWIAVPARPDLCFLYRSWCPSYYWFLCSMVLLHFIPSWFAWDCTYVWICSFSDVHVQFPWVLYVVCWMVILVAETEKMGTTDRCFLVVFFGQVWKNLVLKY